MNNSRVNKKLIIIGTIVILALLLPFTFVAAQDFPRAIHLSWQNDPATTMTLMWRSIPGAEGVVEYGKDLEYTHSVISETHN